MQWAQYLSNIFQYCKHLNRQRNIKTKELKNNIKIFFLCNEKRIKTDIDLNNITDIAILMYGKGIGDAIVLSGLIKILKEQNYKITILAEKRIAFYFENNSNIDKVILVDKSFSAEDYQKLKTTTDFDLLIDLYDKDLSSYIRFKIIKAINAKHTIGFNQKQYNIFDHSIEYKEYKSHITKRLTYLLDYLQIPAQEISYDVPLPEDDMAIANGFLQQYLQKYSTIVIFNPFSTNKMRDFSLTQIDKMTQFLNSRDQVLTIIIGEHQRISQLKTYENIIINPHRSFFVAAALVKSADLVITPDTSIVHLANTFNRRMICTYNNRMIDRNFINNYVWSPNYPNAVQLFANKNQVSDILPDILIQHIQEQLDLIRNEKN
ncbi:glycosyltransferase family 9 protein [Zophobihabitans entericus]|uniref:Glycosyltransferase family 9 protein n=1 Tax=Zophobihabitans entericus TaxID=1635327 RepID=A0A6G9IBK9_9GAMM|nr:glycosyltransferase family 9 protein [Zophobihabitans entericus]QIQ21209.1 glycosyltransferase family 9 protein [Zophobihabitans entericus]